MDKIEAIREKIGECDDDKSGNGDQEKGEHRQSDKRR